MSSWDSMYSTDRTLKIKGQEQGLTIQARIVYDTPHYVSYELFVNFGCNKSGLVDVQDLNGFVAKLKHWSRESSSIDARASRDMQEYKELKRRFSGQTREEALELKIKGEELRNFIMNSESDYERRVNTERLFRS